LKRYHPEFAVVFIPACSRDARPTRELLVDLGFVLEERGVDVYMLEFQGDFLLSLEVAP